MDLTVRRFRQIVAAINARMYLRRREEISLISWQTRNLAGFIAGGYMTDGNNPAIDIANTLAFDDIEAEQIKESQKLIASSTSNGVRFDEDGDIISDVSEPQNGTFERFMGSMGNPRQWKG